MGGEVRCDDTHTISLSLNYNPGTSEGTKDEAFPVAAGIP